MTVAIRDSDGTERLRGDLIASGGATGDVLTQQADGTYAPAAGGSPPVTARQNLSGGPVSIGNGANARLTWDSTFGPNVLLDRSTLDVPSVLTDGIYAVSVAVVAAEAMTVGGHFQVALELDSDNQDATITQDSRPASAAFPSPELALSLPFYIPAAGTIRLTVRNRDGAATRTFALESAAVQKIT